VPLQTVQYPFPTPSTLLQGIPIHWHPSFLFPVDKTNSASACAPILQSSWKFRFLRNSISMTHKYRDVSLMHDWEHNGTQCNSRGYHVLWSMPIQICVLNSRQSVNVRGLSEIQGTLKSETASPATSDITWSNVRVPYRSALHGHVIPFQTFPCLHPEGHPKRQGCSPRNPSGHPVTILMISREHIIKKCASG
jgi:hypothetical protein